MVVAAFWNTSLTGKMSRGRGGNIRIISSCNSWRMERYLSESSRTTSSKTISSWFVPHRRLCKTVADSEQIQFSRANALAAYKAKNLDDINKSARIVQHIQEEMGLHIKYCEGFGLTRAEIESHKEHPGKSFAK